MERHSPSLWMDQVDATATRVSLDGDLDVDVAIIGAGYTGLWTAYTLAELQPDARIVVLEANRVGFGASGRNGGWCIGGLAADSARWTKLSGFVGAERMHRAMVETVDEIERTVTAEKIDCDWARGGELHLARNGGQVARLRKHADGGNSRWLDEAEASAMCGATGVRGALFDPATAALHPAKLVQGLAQATERRGVTIYEDTRVTVIGQGSVLTGLGHRVTAGSIVLATEGYTSTIDGRQRDLVPFYSLMIATEPLSEGALDEVRLHSRPTFTDGRFRVIYGQRTADNRLAFGGRVAGYRFGSKIDRATEEDGASHEVIRQTLVDLFPVLERVEITHRWGGVLGVPRNWTPAVEGGGKDGLYRAGGYVGEGVAAANLAGRCVAHLIAETGHDICSLPWVRPFSRRWPMEPFRYAAIRAGAGLFEMADRRERRTDRPAREADLVWKVLRR